MGRIVSQLVLTGWGIACVVVSAYLLAAHLLTLPTPDAADAAVRTAIADSRSASERDRWLVVHVLAADCKCSRRVLDHLFATERPRDRAIAERIVWITADGAGDAPDLAAMRAHGFTVEVVAPAALLARYHLESAPLLLIAAPDGRVEYLGGYTTRKQAADVEDLVVIAAIRRGERVAALPAFGCAVGQHLTAQVDPLGIRSWL